MHGQDLLTRGMRVLGAKPRSTASVIASVAKGQLSVQPKSFLTSKIKAAARGGRSHNTRGSGVRGGGRHAQRVVVKARIAPTRGKNPGKAIRQHLAYIERDGVDRNGHKGQMFGSAGNVDREHVDAFAERCESRRHQFRFIVSPERGGDLDLERYTRDLMRRMEHDVGTRLDFVACVHHDTDQPHVHIVVNGKDQRGGDLVISRDYIGHGLRYRATELATNELGYRADRDVFQSLARDVHSDRFTAIDKRLQTLQERDARGLVDLSAAPRAPRAALQRRLQLGRLAYLGEAGLAEQVARGIWRLRPDAMEQLRGHTQHREIQRQVDRHIQPADRASSVEVVDKAKLSTPILGKVLGRGLANELSGTNYLVVAGIDGKIHYAALSFHSERHLAQTARRGDIVSLNREVSQPTGQADRNLVAIALRNKGVYDPRKHLSDVRDRPERLPHGSTAERFVEAHVARAEALSSRGHITRDENGTYKIPADLLTRVAVELVPARDDSFIKVQTHSHAPLRDQAHAPGFTWLDEELKNGTPQQLLQTAVRTAFQDEMIEAADVRARRLVQLGFAQLEDGALHLDPQLRRKLEQVELDSVVTRLSHRHGTYADLEGVRHFSGRVVAIESLSGGARAVVVTGNTFTLAPADGGLAKLIGKDVSLSMRPDHSPGGDELQKARVRFQALDAMRLAPSLGPSLGR
jgi:type IV secretory pathway VirD2 relaxase